MENKTKIILTIIGLAALIVPAVLLVVFTGKGPDVAPDANVGGSRQIRQDAIQNEINNNPLKTVVVSPSPVPSPSPSPKATESPNPEGTPASGVN